MITDLQVAERIIAEVTTVVTAAVAAVELWLKIHSSRKINKNMSGRSDVPSNGGTDSDADSRS
jgi:hypothetical protein